MGLDDIFYDREAEAGPAGVAGPVFVDSVEAFENVRLIVGRNPGAIICDGDTDFRAMARCGDSEMEICGGAMPEGIANQVGENFLDPGTIDLGHSGVRFPVNFDFCLGGADIGFEVIEDTGKDIAEVIRAEVEEFGTVLQAGYREQIVDEQREPARIFMHDLERAFSHFPIIERPVEEGFQVADDDCQRRSKLVGNIRNKFPSNGFQPTNQGHIVKDKDNRCRKKMWLMLEPRDMDIKVFRRVAGISGNIFENELKLLRGSPEERGFECLLELVVAKNLNNRAVKRREGQVKHPDERIVGKSDPLRSVDDQNPLHHAGENGP